MKQSAENRMLVVRRYWVRSGEPPLGYATHRYYPLIGLIGTTLLSALVVTFLIMRAETLLVLSVAVLVLFSVASMLLIRRYSGWYEVDAAGNPLTLVSRSPLPGITVRNSISRKQFLEQGGIPGA
ncbi:MAG: hypothetical protein IRZ31_16620 [Thermogemmatispora sp.]|uniref:hypothetical protein n=1 Tax=Thermogemmatispora sp. TaxID=1968838 RepID=UPI00260FF82B|nr:hypothetical protein [Thermogemmatispora sp.]MBX5458517.1 hypothetical protein [Thermogemmatispora sp.]